MRKRFIFEVQIPYNKISIKKAQLFSKKIILVTCDGNKKVVRLKFLFKEVKFNVQN